MSPSAPPPGRRPALVPSPAAFALAASLLLPASPALAQSPKPAAATAPSATKSAKGSPASPTSPTSNDKPGGGDASVTAAGVHQLPVPAAPTAAEGVGPVEPDPALRPPPPPPPVGASAAERQRWLGDRIDEILGRAPIAGARVAIAVADLDGGKLIYAKNERQLMNPASNAKLFTTAAALGLLGPEYRFRTHLLAESVKNGDVPGNLWLRGTGDPSLSTEDLWKLAASLAASGVKRVGGAIAVDDTWFDEARWPPAFEQKEEDTVYRVPTGAVAIDRSTCAVHVFPGKEGAPPRVVVEPPSSYVRVVNQAKTVSKGRAELSIASREAEGHTEIVLTGRVRTGSGERVEQKRIHHPDLFAAHALRELLVKRGIKVVGDVVRAPTPTGAKVLAAHASPPLGVLVREVNKTSNNFMAEQLLRALGAEVGGRPGTFEKGVAGVGKYLEGLGIPAARYKMVNGSGLYDANRFTPAQLVELLRAAWRDFRYASDFVGSLAVAGADGTIGKRMEGSPAQRYVRAKTGTLSGVSALSGYAGAAGHMPLAFSILMNDLSDGSSADAKRAQDAIAEAIVVYLQSDTGPTPTVQPAK